jgi:hypothetical protein
MLTYVNVAAAQPRRVWRYPTVKGERLVRDVEQARVHGDNVIRQVPQLSRGDINRNVVSPSHRARRKRGLRHTKRSAAQAQPRGAAV